MTLCPIESGDDSPEQDRDENEWQRQAEPVGDTESQRATEIAAIEREGLDGDEGRTDARNPAQCKNDSQERSAPDAGAGAPLPSMSSNASMAPRSVRRSPMKAG